MTSSKNDAPPPSFAPHQLEVIHENTEILVLNKPPNVPMDGDVTVYPRTVESMVHAHMKEHGIYDNVHERLQQEGKRKKQLKFVHQLDFSTSGVLCLAFTKDMAARLAHCFEMRTTRKYYVALLHGHIADNCIQEEVADADTKKKTPFEEWVAQCRQVWHDIGSVQVDACASFSVEDNEKALDGFRHLLCTSSANTSQSAVGAKETETHAPVVHRHCASTPPDSASSSNEALHDDAVYRLLGDVSAASALPSLTIDIPVGYDSTDAAHFRMAATAAEQGRAASTSLLVLKRTYMKDSSPASVATRLPVTLVLLSPHTGRRHQLRVHCRAVGFPIVGDTAYCVDLPWCRSFNGPQTVSAWSQTSAPRMYLHAWRLLLPGAVTGHTSESERVAMKKKRRRETLGLSQRSDAAVSAHQNEWTEFVAPVHFPDVVMGE